MHDVAFSRRDWLRSAAAIAGSAALSPDAAMAMNASAPGRLRQSVCRWPFGQVPLPEFAQKVKAMGIVAIDLLVESEWPVVRDAGLVCSMVTPTTRNDFLARGLNDRANHALVLGELERAIEGAARFGWPNVICMPGNRNGKTDAEVVDTTVEGLRRIVPLAEERKVTIHLEMLNSRVDHVGFSMDTTALGAAIAVGVGSERVKLLYDVYHMQIMEGDVIRTMATHAQHIGHVHTAGVPGRHEIDDAQELQYPAIMRALAERGFTGFVAHEFVPTGPWEPALREAVQRCTV
ncbi:MAG: TIM barrel protein [Gemmatimonadaceae bacterium]|jgi:hydroxypyruvate isomerase|nr:TIM barrel protein [Gemmatimonadaceae bacterium]